VLRPCCVLRGHGQVLALPSFPTRRSSDLLLSQTQWKMHKTQPPTEQWQKSIACKPRVSVEQSHGTQAHTVAAKRTKSSMPNDERSEEHTSELQSRFDLVCRLLLEKKKTIR